MSEPTFEEALHDLRTNHASDQHASCDPDQVCLYRDDEDLVRAAHAREVEAARREQARKDAHVAELHQGCGGRHSNPNRQCVSEVRDQILRSVEEKP